MAKRLSVYLDLVRVLAAIAVFLSHVLPAFHVGSSQPVFGHDAVVFFFVLSGFVIAFVCDTRELRVGSYAAARLARLWSVMVPALLLGLVVYAVVGDAAPFGRAKPPLPLLSSALALIFCGEGWGGSWEPPYNGPFWSLNYEAWYYACYGAFCFLKGRARWMGTVALAALAGPRVLALAPCWLAGTMLYHARARLVMRPAMAWAVLVASLLTFAVLNHFEVSKISRGWLKALTHGQSYHLGSSQGLIGDYALTLAVFANFAAAASLPALLQMLEAVRRPVVLAASFTLSLYLYHTPLLVLAVWLFGLSEASGLQGVCAATAFVAVCLVPLWLVTDQQRWRVHAWLVWLGTRRIATEQA